MNIDKAIEVLKKLHNWLDYGAGELEPTANTVMKAIDTVLSLINTENKTGLDDRLQEKSIEVSDSQGNLSNKKDRLYTDKDMEAFAEWCSKNKWYAFGQEEHTWYNYTKQITKTTTQLRKMWEQERGAK